LDEVTRSCDEASDWSLPRRGVAAGLRGDALDDREKVARTVADFPEQHPQRLFAALLLGSLDCGGDDAANFSVRGDIRIDPEVEPPIVLLSRDSWDTDLQTIRRCSQKHCPLGGDDGSGRPRRQEIAVELSDYASPGPCGRHVLRPDNAKIGILVKHRNSGVAQRPQQPKCGLGLSGPEVLVVPVDSPAPAQVIAAFSSDSGDHHREPWFDPHWRASWFRPLSGAHVA
jgi:hypothetical protein